MICSLSVFGQGRNEYEKKYYLEIQALFTGQFRVVSDDSKKNRRDDLLYPNGQKVTSLTGLFGLLESLNFEYVMQISTGVGTQGTSTVETHILFKHKDEKEYTITKGSIMILSN